MCGIAGFFSLSGPLREGKTCLQAMAATMVRRGPDSQGTWLSDEQTAGLAFRRLAIMDLSSAGDQPMVHRMSGSALVFNGEIYNFRSLRDELSALGHSFHSQSDSEVVLKALVQWGASGALPRFEGMFALAFYEASSQNLVLARDPFGIKPLHCFFEPARGLCFASQFNTLQHGPWSLPATWDPAGLQLFLRLSYLPAPYGFFSHCFQVEPGEIVRITSNGNLVKAKYFSIPQHTEQCTLPSGADESTWNAWLERGGQALKRAVHGQMSADVPLGLYLSGGMDSALVSSAASERNGAVQAFTMGFPQWNQDESSAARQAAQALGLQHHVHLLDDEDLVDLVEEALLAQTEPFADYSTLPSLALAKFARSHVKVILSGDGGDELFFGYERPFSLMRCHAWYQRPYWLRRQRYLLGRMGLASQISDASCHSSPGEYYFSVNSRFPLALLRQLFQGALHPLDRFTLFHCSEGRWGQTFEFCRRAEIGGQLQRCLKKVDLTSMHYGLEVRVPMLDPTMVHLAFSLPHSLLWSGGVRKEYLRRLLQRRVPSYEVGQKKLGFSAPLGRWFRGPLRPWLQEQLNSLSNHLPMLSSKAIDALAKGHQAGQNHTWSLWALCALAGWCRNHQRRGRQP